MERKQVAIGIDLGTTTSLAGCLLKGVPIIFPNERGNLLTPCIVAFRSRQTAWVGELARNLLTSRKRNQVVVYPMRYIGTEKVYAIGDREYSPSEVLLIILRKLRDIAAKYLKIRGNRIRKVILTAPAHFNDTQRLAIVRAGKHAGFDVVRLVSEPVAAAAAHGFLNTFGEERLLVFDLGGLTLDITLIEVADGSFYIRGTSSTDLVGGIRFDEMLARFLARKFEEICGANFSEDTVLYQNLLHVAEKTKIDLSFVEDTEVLFPYLLSGSSPKKTYLNVRINRTQFDKITAPLFEQIRKTVMDAFKRSSIVPGWVSTVIMSGGCSRIPRIKDMLLEILSPGVQVENHIPPEQTVAIGASVLSGIIDDPERLSQLELQNITSYHLGLEDNDGNMVVVIPRGNTYPCEVTRTFTTAEDNEDEAVIHILQSKDPENSRSYQSLGQITLDKLPPARAGEPNIKITFAIDEYGVLKVSVKHPFTKESTETIIKTGQWKGAFTKPERRGTGLRVL